jgi:hypothetical protein
MTENPLDKLEIIEDCRFFDCRPTSHHTGNLCRNGEIDGILCEYTTWEYTKHRRKECHLAEPTVKKQDVEQMLKDDYVSKAEIDEIDWNTVLASLGHCKAKGMGFDFDEVIERIIRIRDGG